MDQQTLEYYDRNAVAVASLYREASTRIAQHFQEAFPTRGRVLDVGAGSGRDTVALLDLGHNVYGLEPSEGMRAEAIKAFPKLEGRLLPHSIPLTENTLVEKSYDGILCSAVLMHVPPEQIFDAVFSLKRVLRDGGRLLLSVPEERPGLGEDHRDPSGRLFHPLPAEYLVLMLERLGFATLRRWSDSDGAGRPGVRWTTLLLELHDARRGRPLDRIETVLNRDRKTASYKLALFRALSEIGTRDYHHAHWVSHDEVAIPIRVIAEKWFRYYWPIFESRQFIPQINGETPGCHHPVAFRALQTKLIQQYRDGGLSRFLVDHASGSLTKTILRLYKDTLGAISNTIRAGPVVYASGDMFRYDPASRSVIVGAGAWREFWSFGHWIEPAVLFRWADETERMAKREIRASAVLEMLMAVTEEDRDVLAARKVYATIKEAKCVWSDKLLRTNFAVDHVIPFSLWHNNALWNLLPSDPKENQNKSDKLPERDLLVRQKPQIIFYWEVLHRVWPLRFEHELRLFTGHADVAKNWQNLTFARLAEAVEVTAVQRGCDRWSP